MKNIANNIGKDPIFTDGYIAKINQGLNNNNVAFTNQDLIIEIKELLKTNLKSNYQEKWTLNIKNENINEQNEDELIAGDKIFTIDVEIETNDQKVNCQIKRPLYVSVKIADGLENDVLLEQTGKYLVKIVDDAVMMPNQKIEDVMWYKNFTNQLIDTYKANSYQIDSINEYDFQTGSYPNLLKTFKLISQKDKTFLNDIKTVFTWISECRFMEKIILKFKTLAKQFADKNLQIKFTQQIGENNYVISDSTDVAKIYNNNDPLLLKKKSKIILEMFVEQNKKITLETKEIEFEQFILADNFLASFLCTVIENELNKKVKGIK